MVSLGSRSGAGNPVLPCAGGEDSCALGCALARVVVLTKELDATTPLDKC